MKFYNSDINSLIADAIVNCKELQLDGICTLSCKLTPANIDHKGLIAPPKYIIEVKESPSNINNSATQLISAAYNIQIDEAKEVYAQWIESIRSGENSSTIYTIPGVGVITKGAYNSTSFKSERQLLSNLNFLNEAVEDEPIVATSPIIPPVTPTPTAQKSDENSNNNRKIIIIIIIAVALIALAALLIKNFNSEKVEPQPVIEQVAVVDTVKVVEEAPKIETIRDGRYHVICGVYVEPSNAERSVASYSAEGYSPVKEFFADKGRFYISLKGFEDRSEAQKLLNSITPREEEGEDGYLWIYQHQQ